MEISLRDERGQGVIEYVLVLVVAVTIILGGMYQLNSAFKVWATNYFGNYLACLLETGELPTISGSGGDSGICNQAFKPFSLAEGRQLRGPGNVNTGTPPSGGGGGGAREQRPGSVISGGGGGAGGGRYGGGSSFRGFGGRSSKSKQAAKRGGGGKSDPTYTGSTEGGSYAGGYSSPNKRQDGRSKTRLDTRFAFEDTKEQQKRRSVAGSVSKSAKEEREKPKRNQVNAKSLKKDEGNGPSSGFTVAGFLRWLIMAAILIAILLFLGGQALQIGKSMEK